MVNIITLGGSNITHDKQKFLATEGRVWLILQGKKIVDCLGFLFKMDFEDQIIIY